MNFTPIPSFYSDGRISVSFLKLFLLHFPAYDLNTQEVKIETQDWHLCSLGVAVTNDRKHRVYHSGGQRSNGSLGANLMVSAGRLFPFRGPRREYVPCLFQIAQPAGLSWLVVILF